MPKCTIKYDPEYSTAHEVSLVSFTNGQIDASDDAKVTFNSFFNTTSVDGFQRRRKKKILVADTGRLQYAGYNFGPEGTRTIGLCRFYVGLFNKRTKKMRVISAQHYKMQPVFELCEKQMVEEGETSRLEKVDLLTEAFGSKKKRKAMEDRQKYSVHSSSLLSAAKVAITEGKDVSAQLASTNESHAEIIPPQNKEATKAKDVYQIHDIITEKEYDALCDEVELFCNASKTDFNTWKEEERFPLYVLEQLLRRKSISEHTAKLLAYTTYLMYMLDVKAKDAKKKDPLPDVREPFKRSILQKYTVEQRSENGRPQRSFPQRLKDKLIANLLVLALFLDDFQLHLDQLQERLKIPMTKLINICYALGCHISTHKNAEKGSTRLAVLKIPLFVKSAPKGRKRK